MRLSLVLAQLPVILGHRFLVALRHCLGLSGARCESRRGAALYLKFQAVDGVENLLVHALDNRRIAGEAARIKTLHLPREFLRLFGRLWIAFDHLAKLVQFPHLLLERSFGIYVVAGRIIGLGPWSAATILIVAGVDVVPHRAIGAALISVTSVARRAAYIAGTPQAAAALTCGVSALLISRLRAAGLPLLQIARPAALRPLQAVRTAAISVPRLLCSALPVLLGLT